MSEDDPHPVDTGDRDSGAPASGGNGSELRSEKLAEIRQRIELGYYDDANHLAELAERLIKKLGLE